MTLDVRSGHLTSIAEIVGLLVNAVDPSLPPEFGVLANRPERPARVADTERTLKYLGWQARIPLLEGLDRTLAWYRQRGCSGASAHATGPEEVERVTQIDKN